MSLKPLLFSVIAIMLTNVVCAQLGTIPTDRVIERSLDGIQIEISIGFWIDPDDLSGMIPPGTKLTTVSSYGIPDSIIGEEYKDWVDASLLVIAADSMSMNGELLSSTDSSTYSDVALWVEIEEGELNDPNQRGINQAIELGYWVPDPKSADIMNSGNWNADVGKSHALRTDDGWQFSIQIEDSEISGTCTLRDTAVAADYELPAYSTIWQPGQVTEAFTVYTYQGHKSQRCTIDEFEVTGHGPVAKMLSKSLQIQQPYGWVMFGWEAKAGHFRRNR